MVGNPYRSPSDGFARDDTTSRYRAQKNKMQRRLLGSVAVIAGLCLVLLAFEIRDLLAIPSRSVNRNRIGAAAGVRAR